MSDGHEGHEVERLTGDTPINPPAGFPLHKFYCWDCRVGWDEEVV